MPRRRLGRETAPTDTAGPQAGAAQDSLPDSESSSARALPAGLYLLATPIGAARDITLRALDILAQADVLAAEDTRSLRRLMDLHGIALRGRLLLAYHDHNGPRARPRLMAALAEGQSVAYASEAGTPMVADPGYRLVGDAAAAGHRVTAAPGASAALAALCVAGLPSDRFCFLGFPPSQKSARRRFAAEIATIPATLILYESPRRVRESLADLADTLGEERQGALCRELTKRHEEVIRGSLGQLRDQVAERELRGEIVLVLQRGTLPADDPEEIDRALVDGMKTMSLREAADHVARTRALPRREVYQRALTLRDRDAE